MHDKIFIETKAEIAEEVVEIVEESMMKAFEGLLLSDPSKMDSNIQRPWGCKCSEAGPGFRSFAL